MVSSTILLFRYIHDLAGNTLSIHHSSFIRVGLSIDLGIGIKGIQERLKHIKKQTDYLKNSPVVSRFLLNYIKIPLIRNTPHCFL